MIIKARGAEGSWRFYDGVWEVQYSNCHQSDIPKVEVLSTEENCGVSFETDGIKYESFLDPDALDSGCLCIAYFGRDDKPRQLYVNRETYLLNDSGKTIERLF